MAITIPNSGSVITGSTAIANSQARWAILGFTTTPGASGSMLWMSGSSEASGSPLLPIVLAINATYQSALLMSPCGFFAACITGGSPHIWLKNAS